MMTLQIRISVDISPLELHQVSKKTLCGGVKNSEVQTGKKH